MRTHNRRFVRRPFEIWDMNLDGNSREWVWEDIMPRKKVEEDPHAVWMQNVGKLVWIAQKLMGRNITAGTNKAARDRAVEAYVRLSHITKGEMVILPNVKVGQDYAIYKDKFTYQVFLTISLYGSEPIRITTAGINEDTLYISTEHFYITFPITMTEAEKGDLQRFLELSQNIDPLSQTEAEKNGA